MTHQHLPDETPWKDPIDARKQAGLILLFLAAGLLVFFVGVTFAPLMPVGVLRGTQIGLILLFALTCVVMYRRNRLQTGWKIAFAYLTAFCAVLLSDFTGDWVVILSDQSLDTASGFATLKLGEDAAIVGVIVVLTLLSGDDLRVLYLCKGRLSLGLTIGLPSFAILTILGLTSTISLGIPNDRVLALLPSFAFISLADGFMEELLFRGLFLNRLRPLVGFPWANTITATVFALTHLGVEYSVVLPTFIMIVFLLGLLWGWLMERTGSLLASSLIHAGVDMLVISDALPAFGVQM